MLIFLLGTTSLRPCFQFGFLFCYLNQLLPESWVVNVYSSPISIFHPFLDFSSKNKNLYTSKYLQIHMRVITFNFVEYHVFTDSRYNVTTWILIWNVWIAYLLLMKTNRWNQRVRYISTDIASVIFR